MSAFTEWRDRMVNTMFGNTQNQIVTANPPAPSSAAAALFAQPNTMALLVLAGAVLIFFAFKKS